MNVYIINSRTMKRRPFRVALHFEMLFSKGEWHRLSVLRRSNPIAFEGNVFSPFVRVIARCNSSSKDNTREGFKGNTLSQRRFRRLIVSREVAHWWERGSGSRLYPRPLIKSFAPLILVGFTTANENFRREIKKCCEEKLIVRDWSV